MKIVSILSMIVLVSISSCQEEEVNLYDGDYLVFGHFYGECLGETCVETFKLEDSRLLEDSRRHSGENYNFEKHYRVLSEAQFERAQELLDIFPTQLLSEPDSTFGCPDCYDQGGLYIEYQRGEAHGRWFIDQTQEDVPTYLHEFMDRVNETIRLLSE